MFKKLRIRFIILTMISVLAVLVIIMTAVNILNYRSIMHDSDRILQILSENQGRFPGFRDIGTDGNTSSPEPQPGQFRHPQRNLYRDDGLTEETPFESRYFSVTLDAEGNVVSTDTDNIAAVDDEKAGDYGLEAAKKSAARGFTDNYRYLVNTEEDNTTIFFLDCTRSLANVHSFLLTSILVSVIGLAAVMLLVIIFSRRIVRPIQESYDKQKRFITDAGHELKTPLTVINADLSVLEMDTGSSEWIDDARIQIDRLTKLTNDLVYLSRMDEEQRRIEMIDFPISDVITEAAQSFRARAIIENKTFESSIQPMLTFHGDEKAIRELVSILLDNALKYSPEGGTIRTALFGQGKNIILQIYNTAESIDPASTERLFDRFYRTDASRNSETGGFGLGLAIARAVVTAHRGRIQASSEDGHSLMITVQL